MKSPNKLQKLLVEALREEYERNPQKYQQDIKKQLKEEEEFKKSKAKKLLSAIFLFLLIACSFSVAPSINAMQIPEGAVVKTANNPDVYIIKYKNGKQFKRLVLNPQVFESYGHLKWEDILIIDQSEMNSFAESTLVKSDGENDVYKLAANGDSGDKAIVETGYTYDPDSVYTINSVDFGNYLLKKLGELAGRIDELQKQIDDLKTETTTPKIDFCNNIEGAQTSVPAGMYRTNGNCLMIETPKIDFCNNIEGLQTYVPSGMYRDNGNCFAEAIVPEPTPSQNDSKKVEELQRITKATQALQQLTVLITEANNELDVLYNQLEEKKAAIAAESERPQSMESMLARQAKLTDEYNALVGPYNIKLERYKKMLSMQYVIEYYKNNIYITTTDRAFLGSLGINL